MKIDPGVIARVIAGATGVGVEVGRWTVQEMLNNCPEEDVGFSKVNDISSRRSVYITFEFTSKTGVAGGIFSRWNRGWFQKKRQCQKRTYQLKELQVQMYIQSLLMCSIQKNPFWKKSKWFHYQFTTVVVVRNKKTLGFNFERKLFNFNLLEFLSK